MRRPHPVQASIATFLTVRVATMSSSSNAFSLTRHCSLPAMTPDTSATSRKRQCGRTSAQRASSPPVLPQRPATAFWAQRRAARSRKLARHHLRQTPNPASRRGQARSRLANRSPPTSRPRFPQDSSASPNSDCATTAPSPAAPNIQVAPSDCLLLLRHLLRHPGLVTWCQCKTSAQHATRWSIRRM